LLAGVGSIVMTPAAPLLLFCTATIAALARWLSTHDDRWRIAVGVAVGAALLTKYTALFLVVAIAGWLLTTSDGRRALRTPWPWAALALAVGTFAPNVAWNFEHGWVSYLKQGSRLAEFDLSQAPRFLPELALSQVGLATPFVFSLAVIGIWRLARIRDARSSSLIWLTGVPTVVFVEHAFFDQVQGQWVAIAYPSACIAAAGLPASVIANWLKPSLVVGFTATLAAYAQALVAPFPVPPGRDPVAAHVAGWDEFTAAIAERKAAFITAAHYGTLAEIAYYAPADAVVVGFDPRWAYFDMTSAQSLAGATGVMVSEENRPYSPCLGARDALDRKRERTVVRVYFLCDIIAPAAGVVLPRE
jgi:4-amino-4-deoxy-L-arabinose transferase-like glycosyltransferase